MSDNPDEFEAAFREFSEGQADPDPSDPPSQDEEQGAASAEEEGAGAQEAPDGNPQPANPEIWANATPEQRAAYEAAETRARELEQRVRSDDGRVARFQRDRDSTQRKLETFLTAAQQDGKELRSFVGSQEWQKAKSDYGEDLAPLFNLVEKLAEHSAASSERWQQADAETIDDIVDANFEVFREGAPDFEALLGHQDFPAWLQSQPKPWQDAYAQNQERLVDPRSAIELVNRFRVHVALKEMPTTPTPQAQQDPRRSRQLDGARSASSRAPVIADPGGDDFDAEFHRAARQLEKQRR